MVVRTISKFMMAGLVLVALPAAVMGAPYQVVKVLNGGTISGKISTSKAPANAMINFTKDKKFCGGTVKADYVIVGAGGTLKNAVVVIENIDKGKAYNKLGIVPFDNKKCMFKPHVTTGVVGQKLGINNSDPILHNTHLYQGKKLRTLYNLALPLQNKVIKKRLKRPGLVTVKCDAHEWMLGYVYVAKSPYITQTGANGRFTIKGIPPGSYKVKIWHETLGMVIKDVTVRAGGVTALNHKF